MNIAERIVLSPKKKRSLTAGPVGRVFPCALVQRAKIIRMSADGLFNHDIAQQLGISRPQFNYGESVFSVTFNGAGERRSASRTIPKNPATKSHRYSQRDLANNAPMPTHWSLRSMAQSQGISKDSVRRIWRQHNLKPSSGRNVQTKQR